MAANQLFVYFSPNEWSEQMSQLVRSVGRERFSSQFDDLFSYKLQNLGFSCWFRSKYKISKALKY
jgi:hypothetical protein